MKIKLSFFFLVCLITHTAFTNPSKVLVKPSSFKVGMYNVHHTHLLKVFLEKQKGSVLKIEISTTEGETILINYVSKRNVKTRLSIDLSQLEDGEYYIVFSNKSEKYKQKLRLTSKQVVENEKRILF